VTIPKYAAKPGDLCLATTLQYSPAVAIPQLQQIMYDFTAKVYQPAYEDFTTLVHTGNTDGLVLINIATRVRCHCHATFPVLTELWQPYAIKGRPLLSQSGPIQRH
jgi:aromatic amino acid aminotransferase I